MGIFDILAPGGNRRGMSPIMMALMGLLAYKALKGKNQPGTQGSATPAGMAAVLAVWAICCPAAWAGCSAAALAAR